MDNPPGSGKEVIRMDPVLSVSYETIARFFEAAEGNYRNAMYIICSCSKEQKGVCGDFLFIPGHDCIPILLPCSDAEAFLGTLIDCTDCAGILRSKTFFQLYHKWLELVTDSNQVCPLKQILSLLYQ